MYEQPHLGLPLVKGEPYTGAEVVWAVRNEMARTVEDVLARRMRLLFLDARAAMQAAPLVAQIMATEMHQTSEWVQKEIETFNGLAKQYLLEPKQPVTSRSNTLHKVS